MLLNRINDAIGRLKVVGVADINFRSTPPVSTEGLAATFAKLRHPIPRSLREVFVNEAESLSLTWSWEGFGISCRRGHVILLSPDGIARAYASNTAVAAEAVREGFEERDEGYAALVRDWPMWVPVFRFPSGDYFSLDMSSRSTDPPVVFQEHDVMDQGPNLHGLRIAESLAALIDRWSAVLFVDLEDWSAGTSPVGIAPDSPVFGLLRSAWPREGRA